MTKKFTLYVLSFLRSMLEVYSVFDKESIASFG
jgi:hypothetical protein